MGTIMSKGEKVTYLYTRNITKIKIKYLYVPKS